MCSTTWPTDLEFYVSFHYLGLYFFALLNKKRTFCWTDIQHFLGGLSSYFCPECRCFIFLPLRPKHRWVSRSYPSQHSYSNGFHQIVVPGAKNIFFWLLVKFFLHSLSISSGLKSTWNSSFKMLKSPNFTLVFSQE